MHFQAEVESLPKVDEINFASLPKGISKQDRSEREEIQFNNYLIIINNSLIIITFILWILLYFIFHLNTELKRQHFLAGMYICNVYVKYKVTYCISLWHCIFTESLPVYQFDLKAKCFCFDAVWCLNFKKLWTMAWRLCQWLNRPEIAAVLCM